MTILGIDASGLAASVAIMTDDTILGEIMTNCKLNHSQTLMPMVAELFMRLDMHIGDIDFIVCTNGPGSFTGLRIGAATAMSLAHGMDKKVIPVPTLDVLAYNLYGYAGIVVPIMDARRGQVYTALYDGGITRQTVTRSTNTFNIDGLNIRLNENVAFVPGQRITFETTANTDAVVKNITDMVNAYNDLIANINREIST